jgi:hypothetical protein
MNINQVSGKKFYGSGLESRFDLQADRSFLARQGVFVGDPWTIGPVRKFEGCCYNMESASLDH